MHFVKHNPKEVGFSAGLEASAPDAGHEGATPVVLIFNFWITRQGDPQDDGFYRLLSAPLVSKLTEMGYAVIDTYPALQALMAARGWKNARSLWVRPGDAHPGPDGHRFLAQLLFQAIVERKLLPATPLPTLTDDGVEQP